MVTKSTQDIDQSTDVHCTYLILNYASPAKTMRLARTVGAYGSIDDVLVVDNCSPDNSYEYLATQLQNASTDVIKTDHNGGYGYGNNYGVRHILAHRVEGTREYAVISNPDVMVSEHDVKTLVNCMEHHPGCLAAGGRQELLGTRAKPLYPWNIPSPLQCIAQFGYLSARRCPFDATTGINLTETTPVDCLRGALFIVDCDLFAKIGGYDERVFLYYEETVLGIKARRNNLRLIYCPNSVYYHEDSSSVGNAFNGVKIRLHYVRSLAYVVKEYYGFSRAKVMLCKTLGYVTLPVYFASAIWHQWQDRRQRA